MIERGERCLHRLAPGGLLGKPGNFKVAVVRHQKCARDWRRGHHQDVCATAAAFGLQCQSLMNAEAMLLVDHGKRQIAEHDVILEQRMRADQDVDFAIGKVFENEFARPALFASGQKPEPQSCLVG